MILYILLGILIWQTVTTIVTLITSEEKVLAWVGGFVPTAILFYMITTIRFIRKKYVEHNYTLYNVYREKLYNKYDNGCIETVRIKNENDSKYYKRGENNFFIEKRQGNFKATPNYNKITKIRKNGWFCQEWVDENLIK